MTPEEKRQRQKAATAAWRARNLEHFRAVSRAWFVANRERRRVYRREQYVKNRERELVLARLYKAEHRERLAARQAEYTRRNPIPNRMGAHKRRATLTSATPSWADHDKMADWFLLAALLTEETGIPHEVDHVVPLRGKTVNGLHWEGNMQVLPKSVNRAKSNKLLLEVA